MCHVFIMCVVDRLWDIECGACLRVLEGHEELVRCIRFDQKRIVSGAYDGYVTPDFNDDIVSCGYGRGVTF